MTLRRPGNHPDELISGSLTGELTDAERHELDEHLATCESCRDTLAAFANERRLVSGLRHVPAPRDLSARVRGGIEAGRFTSIPWWRRRGGIVAVGASLATVAAAALGVVVISNLNPGPAGQTNSPGPSSSGFLSSSAPASPSPSATAPPEPALALGAGELGYLSLNGAPFEASRLTFVNDATGASISAGKASGPPIAAALSPDGKWLAYITQKGESGANEVWALHLTDGRVVPLGCSLAAPFTDRLAWSPDSAYLAYTVVAVDLGSQAGCQPPSVGTDVWLFETKSGEHNRFTTAGNAYAADFGPSSPEGEAQLWVSFAMTQPQSALLFVPQRPGPDRETGEQAPGVFLPLISPDGNRAMFWRGSMASSDGGAWQFSRGGMPQLSGDFRSTGPASPWLGTPLFGDLTPVGGEAFAYGSFAWSGDSDRLAFWNGAWTGAPQSGEGTYPSQRDAYVGRVSSGLLTASSRLPPDLGDTDWVADVAFAPTGSRVAVTVGVPSAGIGDPPSSHLLLVSLASGEAQEVAAGIEPPPWNGPAVFGP
jgi:predicted anti-sigma-YlaC factor YlaD